MMRRFDSLPRMLLTLLAAVLLGLLLEAEGLKIWAERLEMGRLRTLAVPVTETWHTGVQVLGVELPRRALLGVKEAWADEMSVARVATPAAQREAAPSVAEALASPQADTSAPLAVASAPVAAYRRPALSAGQNVQVVLAGDSMMAVGLAPALRRGLAEGVSLQIIKAYRSGTGLARPEVFDWLQQYPLMLGDARPALVICSLGANDGQNVQAGKQVLEFGTPGWDVFYRQRLVAYLDLITRDGTRVLWVGMPVMRAPSFARKMQHMNALVQDVLSHYPGVTWLDPNPLLASGQLEFAQYRSNERGKPVKLRADDGIHMTDEGAGFLLPAIRAWLEQQLPAPAVQAGLDATRPVL